MNLTPTHNPMAMMTTAPDTCTQVANGVHILVQFDEEYCHAAYLNDVMNHRFSFNGETYCFESPINWLENPSQDLEWHILLHKFYYAVGLAREFNQTDDARYLLCFQNLVQSWMEQTPPGFIATDVTGRRVQNWIYAWYLFNGTERHAFGKNFKKLFLVSLAEQVNYIIQNLAPARNHRTLELYAVFLAGIAFPCIDQSAHWREVAIREMVFNIESDLLADGVHCELATDYHHIVLRNYLLFYQLAQLNGLSLDPKVRPQLCKALTYSMHVHRPDGYIPALSDSDSRSYLYLLEWGAKLFDRDDFAFVASFGKRGQAPKSANIVFESSGYVVLRSPWDTDEPYRHGRYLVLDCGPIGAGNHGHLDSLNIEIAAFGHPLIVDPGRYTYNESGATNWRARFRSTRAHNTVTVDDQDQAIYHNAGTSKKKICEPHPQTSLVSSQVRGYMPYLRGRVTSPNYDAVHDRHIWFPRSRYWLILDSLAANKLHQYDLRFQLTNAAMGAVERMDHGEVTEIRSPRLTMLFFSRSTHISIEQGFTSVTYGIKQKAPLIRVQATSATARFLTLLCPYKQVPPAVVIKSQPKGTSVTVTMENQSDTWCWDPDPASLVLASSWCNRTWFI